LARSLNKIRQVRSGGRALAQFGGVNGHYLWALWRKGQVLLESSKPNRILAVEFELPVEFRPYLR
jgi:hypothetical protein